MSNLINCPDCGTEISARAEACIKCGAPIAKGQKASSEQTPSTIQHTRKADNLQQMPIALLGGAGLYCMFKEEIGIGLALWGVAIVWWAVVRMLVWLNRR